MPVNTDSAAQRVRRRDAWKSAVISCILLAFSGTVLLCLRHFYVPDGIWGVFVLIAALTEFGMLIPISILLRTRLKEIEGGEEDAASEY